MRAAHGGMAWRGAGFRRFRDERHGILSGFDISGVWRRGRVRMRALWRGGALLGARAPRICARARVAAWRRHHRDDATLFSIFFFSQAWHDVCVCGAALRAYAALYDVTWRDAARARMAWRHGDGDEQRGDVCGDGHVPYLSTLYHGAVMAWRLTLV